MPESLAKYTQEWHEFFREAASERVLELFREGTSLNADRPGDAALLDYFLALADACSIFSDKFVVGFMFARLLYIFDKFAC